MQRRAALPRQSIAPRWNIGEKHSRQMQTTPSISVRSHRPTKANEQPTDQPTNQTNKHATATPQWQTLWVFHEDGTATSAARVALNQADTLKPQRNRPCDDRKRNRRSTANTRTSSGSLSSAVTCASANLRRLKYLQRSSASTYSRRGGTPSTVTQAGALTASSAGAHRACRRRRSAAGTRSPSSGAASSRPPWRPASQP